MNTQDIPYGYCHCGCGEKTKIAPRTYNKRGIKKGKPFHYIEHHEKRRNPIDCFWEKVNKNGPIHPILQTRCWLWTAGLTTRGYGKFKAKGKDSNAHRFSYELHYGPLPAAIFACHHCDNPLCVNPEHLFAGTHQDNMDDKKKKGRANIPSGGEHHLAHFTNDQVREMRRLYASGEQTINQLAALHNKRQATIYKILAGIRYGNV